MKHDRDPLSDVQLAFMNALWKLGRASVSDVQSELSATGRPLAPTTVATVLRRLESKGWVAHSESGRSFLYHAAVPRARATRGILDRLSSALFGGDVPAMVSELLDGKSVRPADLAEIRRLIEAKEKQLK